MANELANPQPSNDDYTKAMVAAGLITEGTFIAPSVNRVKVSGTSFMVDDAPMPYNPKTKEPALFGLISKDITEYYAKWFPDDAYLARAVGRTEIAGRMCKTYDVNEPPNARHAEDGTSCVTCPVNPSVTTENLPVEADKQKCKWSADLLFRIVNPDGSLYSNQEYTLGLSSTGIIEWQGSSKDREHGYVSEYNFKAQLVRLAHERWPERTVGEAVAAAQLALSEGRVLGAFRILPAENKNSGYKWNIPSVTPIDIIEDAPAERLDTEADHQPPAEPIDVTPADEDGAVPF